VASVAADLSPTPTSSSAAGDVDTPSSITSMGLDSRESSPKYPIGPHQQPFPHESFYGFVEKPLDALILIQAAFSNAVSTADLVPLNSSGLSSFLMTRGLQSRGGIDKREDDESNGVAVASSGSGSEALIGSANDKLSMRSNDHILVSIPSRRRREDSPPIQSSETYEPQQYINSEPLDDPVKDESANDSAGATPSTEIPPPITDDQDDPYSQRGGFSVRRIVHRLTPAERSQIRSGSVFMFDMEETGIRRWTVGTSSFFFFCCWLAVVD
jgi:hypothetical protein